MPTGKNKLKNSFSNSKSKMKEQKVKNSGKISRKKQIINLIIVCLALVISYALNVYTGSFRLANVKLLSLLFYSALGFIAFFILYYVVYFITLIRYNKRRKKIANSIISCDDNVAEIFADNGPTLKRVMPRAQGRAFRILKRTSHITIILDAMAK